MTTATTSHASVHARALHTVIEPLHTTLYFAADVKRAWTDLGLEPVAQGYVAGRAAPMGRVAAPTVSAVFFNFNPVLASSALADAWDIASPEEILGARAEAIEAMARRVGIPRDGIEEATALARDAVAGADLAGRPLGAANAAVAPSGLPFSDLWQALTALREHRGDGHVAVLLTSGLSPVEVLAVYAAWQRQVSRRFLQSSRLWDDEAWSAAEASLRERGWVDDEGGLAAAGAAWRDEVEAETDRLAARPYAALGEERTRRLFDLLHPMAAALDGAEDVFPRPLSLPIGFDDAAGSA